MNITKTQSDALNYQVNIEIAAADYADALKKRLNEYRRRADIKGFRKGMAPMSARRRYSLISEALSHHVRITRI